MGLLVLEGKVIIMTQTFMLISVLIAFALMAFSTFIMRKLSIKVKSLGVISLIFIWLSVVLAVGGINRIQSGTYIALAIFFVIGCSLIKPGFKRIRS